ncbi:MAG: sigma-70 family RNA polymerase sigma factor [Fuerstiella sp.]
MAEFPETSYSLIARVQDLDDGASWADFLEIYQPVVFRMARRRGLQDADAQDIVQQVFISISRSIKRWRASSGQPPFRAWLATIARNAITNSLNRRPADAASGSTSVMELLNEQPDPTDTSAEIRAEAKQEFVRWATEQIRGEFTTVMWDVFWRTAIENQPIADVAKATGRTAGSIYVIRYRVIARLKEKFDEVSQNWDL